MSKKTEKQTPQRAKGDKHAIFHGSPSSDGLHDFGSSTASPEKTRAIESMTKELSQRFQAFMHGQFADVDEEDARDLDKYDYLEHFILDMLSTEVLPFQGTSDDEAKETTLRVLSWNLHGFSLDQSKSFRVLGNLTETVHQGCPDIVVLVEMVARTKTESDELCESVCNIFNNRRVSGSDGWEYVSHHKVRSTYAGVKIPETHLVLYQARRVKIEGVLPVVLPAKPAGTIPSVKGRVEKAGYGVYEIRWGELSLALASVHLHQKEAAATFQLLDIFNDCDRISCIQNKHAVLIAGDFNIRASELLELRHTEDFEEKLEDLQESIDELTRQLEAKYKRLQKLKQPAAIARHTQQKEALEKELKKAKSELKRTVKEKQRQKTWTCGLDEKSCRTLISGKPGVDNFLLLRRPDSIKMESSVLKIADRFSVNVHDHYPILCVLTKVE